MSFFETTILGVEVVVGGATAVATITRADGICTFQALAPPFQHLSTCSQAWPCTPNVRIQLIFVLDPALDPDDTAWFIDVFGTICSVGHPFDDYSKVGEGVKRVFDQPVRVICGQLDCPISVQYEVELRAIDSGVTIDEQPVELDASLKCTACSGEVITPPND